jgi:integrase
MAVDDLWYLSKKDENDNKIPSKRHGRGKRWRVRNDGARTQLFDKKTDAERYDVNTRADLARGQYVDPQDGKITVTDYAEEWRALQLHREASAERAERIIRLHIKPTLLGPMSIAKVRQSHLKLWVKDRAKVLSPTTLRSAYMGYVVPMFASAAVDNRIGKSPCAGIRLPEVDTSEYVIASPEQVHALAENLPERYRAVPLVVAGAGPRASETMGLELESVDFLRREIHVRHQVVKLRGGGMCLAPLKTVTSRRIVELASVVGDALARHIEQFPPAPVEIEDRTDPRKSVRRAARLLFTNEDGQPLYRSEWSKIWRPAREAAGLPAGFGLRDLRHYYATVLIYGGANVKTVQLSMGHATPTITLNTYVGYWPDALDRTRALVDAALGAPSRSEVTGS